MATWKPISNTVPQYHVSGSPASGYYLKGYLAGTTTALSMAIDSTGATTLAKCQINSAGYPINGSSAVFIPHFDRDYKLALYTNSTDADANTTGNAVWVVDNLSFNDAGSQWLVNSHVLTRLTNTTFELSSGDGDQTAEYHPGRRIKLTDSATLYGTITKSDYNVTSASKTHVTVEDVRNTSDAAANLSASLTSCALSIVSVADSALPEFELNVKSFGAVGDGVKDDTAAIKAAIDAMTSNTKLVLPPGTYICSRAGVGADVAFDLTGLDNIVIEGYGAKIQVRHDLSTGTFKLFKYQDNDRVTILGIDFDYEVTALSTGTGARSLLFTGDTNSDTSTIKNCTWRDCRFHVQNTADPSLWFTDIYKTPEGDDPDYKIEGFYFSGFYTTPTRLENFTIENCFFDRVHGRACWMWNVEGIKFVNNLVVSSNGRRPILRFIVGPRDVNISGNTFYSNNIYSDEHTITVNRQGVGAYDVGDVTISNNRFFYSMGRSIDIGGGQNFAITGNTFRINPDFDTTYYDNTDINLCYTAIRVGGDSSATDIIEGVSITGNSFDGENEATNFVYGYVSSIDGSSNPVDSIVRGITISGNTLRGAGSIVTGQSGAITIGVGDRIYEQVTISGNTIQADNNGAPAINILSGNDIDISGNNISGSYNNTSGINIGAPYVGAMTIKNNLFSKHDWGIYAGTWPTTHYLFVSGDTGTIAVSDTITGGTSGVTGTVSAITSSTSIKVGTTKRITVTSASGFFDLGETITATSGGTAVVVLDCQGMKKVEIANNFFVDCDGGVRNSTADSPIHNNYFVNCNTPYNYTPGATNTDLVLWDVDNAKMERVTVGAADSGGTGFKVLRIPN